MSAIPLSLLETMTRELGNIPIYSKPLDLQKLSRDLLSYSHTGLSGKMTHVDLIDLIRVLLIDKVNRILKIACQLSGEEATLVLYHGQLSHVSLRNKQQAVVAEGAEAFYRVLNLRKASFTEAPFQEGYEANIQLNFDTLAIQATQFIDENSPGLDLDLDPEALSQVTQIRRVLVVDDDMLIRVMLEKSLSSQGYDVVVKEDAIQAMDYLKENDVDLILTDISMPQVSGIEFLIWLRQERQSKVPVIVMTAFHSEKYKSLSHENNALFYLEKPIKMKNLTENLAKISGMGFKGYLENINMFDFVQLYLFSQEKKLIHIKDEVENKQGQIHLSFGKISHAQFGDLKGEEAFYQMMSIGKGLFFEKAWEEPLAQSEIGIETHKLLMNATLKLDQDHSFHFDNALVKAIEEKVQNSQSTQTI